VLRVEDRLPNAYAEVEVLDDGRPRGATSGSGLGHLGMRERAASMSGDVEIGPRPTGGYRVRVRVPLGTDRG
jgi:signal transduction histidine kinase